MGPGKPSCTYERQIERYFSSGFSCFLSSRVLDAAIKIGLDLSLPEVQEGVEALWNSGHQNIPRPVEGRLQTLQQCTEGSLLHSKRIIFLSLFVFFMAVVYGNRPGLGRVLLWFLRSIFPSRPAEWNNGVTLL
jgi:hypothetical protein